MEKGITNQTTNTINDIISFVEIYKVHSESQKYYNLNVDDLLNDYSEMAVETIKKDATIEIRQEQ